MKKLVLGLLLTVGISGVSFAGESIKLKKVIMKPISCTLTIITNYVDGNGKYLGSTSNTYTVDCGNNPNGTAFVEQKLVIKPTQSLE